MIDIRQDGDAVLLPVKVVPGASRTRLLGELGGRLKVAVASPPEGGQANKALVAFLADRLGIRKGDLTVETGLRSPEKTLRIARTTLAGVRSALGIDAD
jgi:uncharacterized protein (TIGR00251 family)